MWLARWFPLVCVTVLAVAILAASRNGGEAAAGEVINLGLVSVSEKVGETAQPATFRGVSSDGARVFFTTGEKLTDEDLDTAQDVYERVGGATRLVSVSEKEGETALNAIFAGVSSDGARVFFTTLEKLTDDDPDTAEDVYERVGGATRLVSVSEKEGETAETATFAGVSSDGTRVFFTTLEKLTDDDLDTLQDIYERVGGATRLVSVSEKEGETAEPASFRGVSSDGARVFFSTGEKLTDEDLDTASDIYERSGGATRLVSVSEKVGETAQNADFAGVSSDGARVFFRTSEKLTNEDQDTTVDVYERSGGDTRLVSVSEKVGETAQPAIFRGVSSDGARVFFTTGEKLTDEDLDTAEDVYERVGGDTRLVSVSEKEGETAQPATFRGVSSDGTRVFFTTLEKLTDEDLDTAEDVYERVGGDTRLVSVSEKEGETALNATFRGVSIDGTRVFFRTSEKLTDDDLDTAADVYERVGGDTRLVSVSEKEGETAEIATFLRVSSDGARVFFQTVQRLTDEDPDTALDIYQATIESAGFAQASSSISEGAATALLNVVLARAAAGVVTVDYAITGGTAGEGDRTLAAGTLAFAPGETSKDIPLTILQDTLDEASETVVVALSSPVRTALDTATHTVTIIDDDATVGFAAATSSIRETRGLRKVPVTLTQAVASAVTVGYVVEGGTAGNGKDYVLAAGELSFTPGQTARDIAVRVKQDFLVEPGETILLRLLSPAGAVPGVLKHTLTITDDEPHRLKCGGKPATMVGSNGADTLAGTAGADVIVGRGGKDAINGKGGADTLCGSGGDDRIRGGSGNDGIQGGLGHDTLKGEAGRDNLKGQGGKDRLSGGAGAGDACDGGPGRDALLAAHGCEVIAGVP